ncbi:hypothetical protein LCGC14_1773530 [marine sediment metagenome]|uniref:Uncharacterized protein n=1 Tax=marine sediment metagenome TaxID=412755 RepID=A0A0F9HK21_9ZZZZ
MAKKEKIIDKRIERIDKILGKIKSGSSEPIKEKFNGNFTEVIEIAKENMQGGEADEVDEVDENNKEFEVLI